MIPEGSRICESGWMRKGVEIRLGPGDRERLTAVIGSGNSPQKHVWRGRSVLLRAEGGGARGVQRLDGEGKPAKMGRRGGVRGRGVERRPAQATRAAGQS